MNLKPFRDFKDSDVVHLGIIPPKELSQLKSRFPEKCPYCGMHYSFSEGDTYANYGCGSQHRVDSFAQSRACIEIQNLHKQIDYLERELAGLAELVGRTASL